MPFQLHLHPDNTTGLIAVCDVCGKQVVGSDANILWLPTRDEKPGETSHPFRIACKTPCTRKVDLQFGHQYSQELDTGIGYLLHNTQFNIKHVERKIKLLDMI